MTFSTLGLSQPLLRAIEAEGYTTPTPIQTLAIPHILAGADVLGCAQTGSGKTAAFALPILDRLLRASGTQGIRKLRVLVLTPTRELASQIEESFVTYGRRTPLRHAVVFGGVNINRQIQTLASGVDVLVATPGRLLDLMSQRAVSLRDIEIFVLDEADRMLDMGFVRDVKRIASKLPASRQTLLFSATMPDSIRALAQSLLRSPVNVAATPVASAPQTLAQRVYFVEKANKRELLAWILRDATIDRALAFTRTKHSANRVAQHLSKCGISADAIHGDKSQNARERALAGFKRGDLRVLVATDIAARGIDIDRLSYVINYDLPNTPETYVHRIGRTGRAGNTGHALSFCESEERPQLHNIERLICDRIPVMSDFKSTASASQASPVMQQRPAPVMQQRPAQHLQPMAAVGAGGQHDSRSAGRPRHFSSRRRRGGRAAASSSAS